MHDTPKPVHGMRHPQTYMVLRHPLTDNCSHSSAHPALHVTRCCRPGRLLFSHACSIQDGAVRHLLPVTMLMENDQIWAHQGPMYELLSDLFSLSSSMLFKLGHMAMLAMFTFVADHLTLLLHEAARLPVREPI